MCPQIFIIIIFITIKEEGMMLTSRFADVSPQTFCQNVALKHLQPIHVHNSFLLKYNNNK